MRILFVLEHFHPYIGGVEFLFFQLAKSLVAQKNKITVITTQHADDLALNDSVEGIDIIRVPCKNRFSFTYRSIPFIWKHCDQFDLIHTSTYNAAIPTWLVAKLKSKKCILTFHEYWGKLWTRLPYLTSTQKVAFKFFERIIFSLNFDKTIAVSDFTKSELTRGGKKNSSIVRIYNGIDYDQIQQELNVLGSQEKNDIFTFTFIGRLGVSKGLDLIIPAAGSFLKSHPDSLFKIIIPKVPKKMFSRINEDIKNLNKDDQIKMIHHLTKDELYEEMQNSSCLVIPSYSEGFCFIAAEACALGIPVVSSQLGALEEVVSGKFIRMADQTSEGLYNALTKAHNNEWEVTPLNKFELTTSMNQYTTLYQEILNG